ncbi:MAG TPA: branched-chain amino acid transaminase [Candidatus Limnocylindrales bacterium]|nr:branched-chain amino acid transaminase [Candidatus Limnocylindrales bacterium]
MAVERIDQAPSRPSPNQGIQGGYAYFQGEIVPFASAQVSIATHALHYGTACFEGIRGYWNAQREELYLVRLVEHFRRFLKSASILKLQMSEDVEALCAITLDILRRDGFTQDVYVRPIAYKSSPIIKVDLHTPATGLAIYAFPLGDYSSTAGLKVTISSWRRTSDNSIPARGKITGSYVNTALAVEDAQAAGYDDCLLLTEQGHVAEGSAANFFMVDGRTLITSPVTDEILVGITRAIIMRLALDLDLEVIERSIDRTEVYQCDEAFLCGTGVQIGPIVAVDGRPVGSGKPGPITTALQDIYFRAVHGEDPRYRQWVTPVYGGMPRITPAS